MNRASILKLQSVVCMLSLLILSACERASPATPTATLTTTSTVSPTSTVTPIPTNTPEPTLTAAVKLFEDHPASEFDEYYIAPEDLLAFADWKREQLLASDISLSEPDPDKVVATRYTDPGGASGFIYRKNGGMEIESAVRPFLAGDSYGYTKIGYISYGTPGNGTFAVSTVAFSLPGNPKDLVVVPVILINSPYVPNLKSRLDGWAERGFLEIDVQGKEYTLLVVDDLNQKKRA